MQKWTFYKNSAEYDPSPCCKNEAIMSNKNVIFWRQIIVALCAYLFLL